MNATPRGRSAYWWPVLAVLGLVLFWRILPVKIWLTSILQWISNLGPSAPIIFVLLYVIACVCFVPGSLLTIGAGAVFGLVKGAICVSIASVIGAACSFLIGRYLAHGWIQHKLDSRPDFKAIDEAVGREGWKVVLLTRLSPLFPFTLLNYAFGLTSVTFREYVVASWIGMIPGTILYVYIGSLAENLANVNASQRPKSPAEWLLIVLGLLATIVLAVLAARIAKTSLKRKLG